jgi:hypothetical protein
MANVIRIKRRASGAPGAPATLKSAELAHNEVDSTLYIGKGDDGSGNATTIVALAGAGAFADLSSPQTIGGAKTFSTVPKAAEDASGSNDLVRKSQFDSGLGTKADTAHSHAISDVAGLQTALDGKAASSHGHAAAAISDSTAAGRALLTAADAAAQRTSLGLGSAALDEAGDFAAAVHGHALADVTGLQAALDGKAALASPALSGVPTAPTAPGGTSTTQIATTAFVAAAVSALIDGAPGVLDTLNELAAALGDDADFATTLTNGLAEKLAKGANLADLTDAAAARSNLGLATMAVQAASNVTITGGTLDGVTVDGGTF